MAELAHSDTIRCRTAVGYVGRVGIETLHDTNARNSRAVASVASLPRSGAALGTQAVVDADSRVPVPAAASTEQAADAAVVTLHGCRASAIVDKEHSG